MLLFSCNVAPHDTCTVLRTYSLEHNNFFYSGTTIYGWLGRSCLWSFYARRNFMFYKITVLQDHYRLQDPTTVARRLVKWLSDKLSDLVKQSSETFCKCSVFLPFSMISIELCFNLNKTIDELNSIHFTA